MKKKEKKKKKKEKKISFSFSLQTFPPQEEEKKNKKFSFSFSFFSKFCLRKNTISNSKKLQIQIRSQMIFIPRERNFSVQTTPNCRLITSLIDITIRSSKSRIQDIIRKIKCIHQSNSFRTKKREKTRDSSLNNSDLFSWQKTSPSFPFNDINTTSQTKESFQNNLNFRVKCLNHVVFAIKSFSTWKLRFEVRDSIMKSTHQKVITMGPRSSNQIQRRRSKTLMSNPLLRLTNKNNCSMSKQSQQTVKIETIFNLRDTWT
mmetsp:Transcript_36435/g.50079  ORF Transcript_36435/g.50079 Transcript_36435/m.50079 type:complete len:260 (+) Transcript_36435:3-782(+)